MMNGADKLVDASYKQMVELYNSSTDESYHMVLVGQHYPDYLIVELPQQYAWQDVLPSLRGEQPLILRTISQHGEVIAGHVRVIHATHFPKKVLFISYPEQVEAKTLRKTPRMQVDVAATIQLADVDRPSISGRLRDMSGNGFGFDVAGVLPRLETHLIGQQAQVNILLSDDEHEHYAIRICSVEERRPQCWRLGLSFAIDEVDRSDLMQKLLLNSRPVMEIQTIDQIEGSQPDRTLQQ